MILLIKNKAYIYLCILIDLKYNLYYMLTDIYLNYIFLYLINNIYISILINYIILDFNKKKYINYNIYLNVLLKINNELFNNKIYTLQLIGINYKIYYNLNLLIFDLGYSHLIIYKNTNFNINYTLIENNLLNIKNIQLNNLFLISYNINQYSKLKVLNKYKKKDLFIIKRLIYKYEYQYF